MWIYIWLAITVIALIVEFSTADMVSIWFAGGGLIALVLSAINVWWAWQILAFIVISVVLLVAFRKVLLSKLDKGTVKTNASQVIGQEYRLLTAIGLNQTGTIKINDVIWRVDTLEQAQEISEGCLVRIIDIKGNKYIVEEVK